MDTAAAVAALPARTDADPAIARRGRRASLAFLVGVGAREFVVTAERGRIVRVEEGPFTMRAWRFAVRAPESAWEEFRRPAPRPGFHDIFAMNRFGHCVVEGDTDALLSNLRFAKDVLACLRRAPEGAGAREDGKGAGAAGIEPIVGRYLNLDIAGRACRLYFEEAGAGIPLVCLHTAGAHSSQYRHIMCDPAVTDRFRVLAFDMPWHGKSSPPAGMADEEYLLTGDFYVAAIMGFIEAMGLDAPVVMGCSMGGRVVIRLAREHGSRLRAAIGLEGSDAPAPWYDNSWTEHPDFDNGDFCVALVSGLCAPQSPEEHRRETLWHYRQGGAGVFRGDMHFFRTVESDYGADSAAIDTAACPLYLMTGEYDYSCTPEATRRTAARIPGARATIMEGLGHFPMSENPAAFRRCLLPVLDDILARTGPPGGG